MRHRNRVIENHLLRVQSRSYPRDLESCIGASRSRRGIDCIRGYFVQGVDSFLEMQQTDLNQIRYSSSVIRPISSVIYWTYSPQLLANSIQEIGNSNRCISNGAAF
jgi:hypothetical protein